MNKREALTYTKELWTWVAKNPGEGKWAWPGWTTYPLGEDRSIVDCPLCDYAETQRKNEEGPRCPLCPLYRKWLGPKKRQPPTPCCYPGSSFLTWSNSGDTAIGTRAAKAIVKLCEEALDE